VTDTVLAETMHPDWDTAGLEVTVTRAVAISRRHVGVLQPRAFKFLAALPPGLRPLKTGEKYPRIVNQLALLNGEPAGFDMYLDELLINARGNRQGFPQDVADELYRLRTFCEVAVCPARQVCEVMNVAVEVTDLHQTGGAREAYIVSSWIDDQIRQLNTGVFPIKMDNSVALSIFLALAKAEKALRATDQKGIERLRNEALTAIESLGRTPY